MSTRRMLRTLSVRFTQISFVRDIENMQIDREAVTDGSRRCASHLRIGCQRSDSDPVGGRTCWPGPVSDRLQGRKTLRFSTLL
jgi:hypothetical protein